MRSERANQSGFTLIELLVVIIIVAILAAVGIPLLQGNINRAIATEAAAGLGTIRTGMRAYFAENQTYVGATMANIGINTTIGNAANGDLDGRYFDDTDYLSTPWVLGVTTYCASVDGQTGGDPAPEEGAAANISRSIDETGDIYDAIGCLAGGGNVLN